MAEPPGPQRTVPPPAAPPIAARFHFSQPYPPEPGADSHPGLQGQPELGLVQPWRALGDEAEGVAFGRTKLPPRLIPSHGVTGPRWALPCRGAKGLLLAVTLPGKPTSEGWQVKLQPQEPSYLGDPPLCGPPPPSSGRCPELGPPFPDPQRAETVERGMVIFTLLSTSLFAHIFARST